VGPRNEVIAEAASDVCNGFLLGAE
jgi:hypothetical protein